MGRSYTVVGAGAVGLLYGGRLAAAGHDVRWVIPSGTDLVRRDGIVVHSGSLPVHLDPPEVVVADPVDAPPADVVLVALKTTANHRLGELVTPAVADGATVAVFQNGLGVEEQVREAAPAAGAVLGAMCFVCAHRRSPGVCDHLDYGAVTVGRLDGPQGEAERLIDDLVGAGIETTSVDDLGVARWRKLVWNVPFNGLSVVLDATTDALLGDSGVRGLVAEMMDEVILASQAVGHGVDPDFRDEMLATTDAMTAYAPSMKLDHDAGREMEIAAIYDVPLARAEHAGATMVRVAALRDQLRFLERRRERHAGHG